MENEFWQFSDQLRLETTSSFANLSIGDSIWADSLLSKGRTEERRNFDAAADAAVSRIIGAGEVVGKQQFQEQQNAKAPAFDLNGGGWNADVNDGGCKVDVNDGGCKVDVNGGGWKANLNGGGWKTDLNGGGWKTDLNGGGWKTDLNGGGWKAALGGGKSAFANGGGRFYNKDVGRNVIVFNREVNKSVNGFGPHHNRRNNDINDVGKGKGVAASKKHNNKSSSNNDKNNNDKAAADKRFKTLPASEALPRSEAIGGYIFVCNNDTMQENLRRQLFGLPPRYRDSVRTITPGLPLFLYNYSTHQLHGIFEAGSFGGTNIDPTAWEDKKCPGESRFPAQVRVMTRKNCEPLEEDSFRPILHHYDGPKFRLELSVPEALALLDIFAENNA